MSNGDTWLSPHKPSETYGVQENQNMQKHWHCFWYPKIFQFCTTWASSSAGLLSALTPWTEPPCFWFKWPHVPSPAPPSSSCQGPTITSSPKTCNETTVGHQASGNQASESKLMPRSSNSSHMPGTFYQQHGMPEIWRIQRMVCSN